MSDTPPREAEDKKVTYINLAVWGAFTLLFCCGGALLTAVLGAESESDGRDAAMLSAGPACCSVFGLIGVLPGFFALRGKTGLKIALPIVLGVGGGVAGAIGTLVFFESIWQSL